MGYASIIARHLHPVMVADIGIQLGQLGIAPPGIAIGGAQTIGAMGFGSPATGIEGVLQPLGTSR